MKGVIAVLFSCVVGVFGHSIYKQSFPSPKGFHHGKSRAYYRSVRKQPGASLKDRFLEQYKKIMNKSNGYFSDDGVPYHSVETLMCEAPDYGHETTSEAFSEYIWMNALYAWATGDFSPFKSAFNKMESTLIPGQSNQPTDSYYNPQSPATYAPEEDTPSEYPVPLESGVSVGVDPLNNELAEVYGSGDKLTEFYATHWLLDVDNIYGFGQKESGSGTNVFINTFQRGPNESVWRTIPQPDWDDLKYGDSQCGFLSLFTKDPNGCKSQWKYTGAPDADARTIQAVYWAIQFAKDNGGDVSDIAKKAQKLGDFLRYSLWDKYFKGIPCHSENCAATTWSDSWNSTFYLISWYYAWGGNVGSYDWSWRIGASHVHQGYQNVFTAYALSNEADLISKTTAGKDHWSGVQARTLEFWQWLQTGDGLIAGGATNSWKGRYADPVADGITGYFHGLAYDWQPVYHCPPSNNWFGMNAWSMERLAEFYYVTKDSFAENIITNWVKWVKSKESKILIGDNDFQVPSNIAWSGQPDTWTGTWTGNPNLKGTVSDWSKDCGVGSALAHALTFYAKASGDSDAQNLARELLDRIYMYADDQGIGIAEERQDYIGNEYGQGFWEPVYVPSGYSGVYPNGDKIESGVTFIDIRSWYKEDPMWPTVEQAKKDNKAPVFTYHRMWAQAEFAIACADYARLFPN